MSSKHLQKLKKLARIKKSVKTQRNGGKKEESVVGIKKKSGGIQESSAKSKKKKVAKTLQTIEERIEYARGLENDLLSSYQLGIPFSKIGSKLEDLFEFLSNKNEDPALIFVTMKSLLRFFLRAIDNWLESEETLTSSKSTVFLYRPAHTSIEDKYLQIYCQFVKRLLEILGEENEALKVFT